MRFPRVPGTVYVVEAPAPVVEDVEIVVAPTPETQRKLRAGVVERMAKQGKMSAAQLAAARMLGAIWFELDAGMGPPDSLVRVALAGCSEGGKASEPINYALFEPIYVDVYHPWKVEARAKTAGPIDAYSAVNRVVCENLGPRQLDKAYGLRHGSVVQLVAWGLDRFDKLYGENFRSLKIGT